MKYAKKLPLSADMPINSRTRVLGSHGHGLYSTDYSLKKHVMLRKQSAQIEALLPDSLKSEHMGIILSEIRVLGPHIHTGEKCVINFYVAVNGEETKFYEGDLAPDTAWAKDNFNGYHNVDLAKIKEVESFIAQPGDVWLMDTTAAHSVEFSNDQRKGMMKYAAGNEAARWVVQAYFGLPFAEVARAFG